MRRGIQMDFDEMSNAIYTERLHLRLFEKKDAATVQQLCNNINIYKNTLYLPYPYTIDDAFAWIETHKENFDKGRSYEFAITDKANGQLFGAISLSHHSLFQHGEMAYWIGEKYWGKGYGTEVAKAIVEFAFEVKQLHKVFARYFASNPASGRIMEKIGMIQEGILKDHIVKDGQYEDLVYYGIIRPQ